MGIDWQSMVDSGCTGNFMSSVFVKKRGIWTKEKKEPFPLMGFDGKPLTYNNGVVSREAKELPLTMGRHSERTQFDITEAPGCDVVLGLSWLIRSNPTINWSNESIQSGNSQPMLMCRGRVHDVSHDINVRAMSANELRDAITEDSGQVQVLYCKKTEGKENPGLKVPPSIRSPDISLRKKPIETPYRHTDLGIIRSRSRKAQNQRRSPYDQCRQKKPSTFASMSTKDFGKDTSASGNHPQDTRYISSRRARSTAYAYTTAD